MSAELMAGLAVDTQLPARPCATCHPAQAKPFTSASMEHAMESVAECSVLRNHQLMTLNANGYSYRIERKGDQSLYSVTDGKQTLTIPIGWAFGLGAAGQTVRARKRRRVLRKLRQLLQETSMDWTVTLGDQNMRPGNSA